MYNQIIRKSVKIVRKVMKDTNTLALANIAVGVQVCILYCVLIKEVH